MNEKLVKYSKIFTLLSIVCVMLLFIIKSERFLIMILLSAFVLNVILMVFIMEFKITLGKPQIYINNFKNFSELEKHINKNKKLNKYVIEKNKLNIYYKKNINFFEIYCIIDCNKINNDLINYIESQINKIVENQKCKDSNIISSIIFCIDDTSKNNTRILNNTEYVKNKNSLYAIMSFKDERVYLTNILIKPFKLSLYYKRIKYWILKIKLKKLLNLSFKFDNKEGD